jgi:hypothetical protein
MSKINDDRWTAAKLARVDEVEPAAADRLQIAPGIPLATTAISSSYRQDSLSPAFESCISLTLR